MYGKSTFMRLILRLLALAATFAAVSLIAVDATPLADIFLRADPTLQGSFSILQARAFLSVSAHFGLALLSLWLTFSTTPAPRISRTGAWLAYGALGLELLTLTPCVFAGSALCGLYYIFLGPITALVMLAGFGLFVVTGSSRALRHASTLSFVALGTAALGGYWYFTPQSAAECSRISDDIKRGTCVMNFALQTGDDKLCEQIALDSARWSCIYQIAERKGDAALCLRISLPCRYTALGPACEPERFRDTCYLVTARKLGDPALCGRVTPGDSQASCRKQAESK